MSAQMATRIAWSTLIVSTVLFAASAILGLARPQYAELGVTTGELARGVPLLAFGWTGALIISHHPRHPVGWLSSAWALAAGSFSLGFEYAVYGLITNPGAVPGAAAVGWLGQSGFAVLIGLLIAVFLLFPMGRSLLPRWTWALHLTATGTVCLVIANLGQWPRRGVELLEPEINTAAGSAVDVVAFIGAGALLTAAVAAAASLVIRFRRSGFVERQQIKWVVFAVVAVVVGLPLTFRITPEAVSDAVGYLLVALVPVAVGAAVLRYHLYDIDRLISRTLAYTLLTALLAAVYGASVLGLGLLFGDVRDVAPSWAVACATLAAAAVFQPARRSVQQVVDRRFNRRSYDAAAVITTFGSHIRDHFDGDALGNQVLAVIDQTMQPIARSMWLRAKVNRRDSPHVPR